MAKRMSDGFPNDEVAVRTSTSSTSRPTATAHDASPRAWLQNEMLRRVVLLERGCSVMIPEPGGLHEVTNERSYMSVSISKSNSWLRVLNSLMQAAVRS